MKRIVALLLAFLLCIPVALAETDFADMSLEELLKLQQETEAAIQQRQSESQSDSLIGKLMLASVGDYITFGTYEQDNRSVTNNEPIEWLVLDKKDNRLLVISKYGLDAKLYSPDGYAQWHKSYLRSWLNDEFINIAFTDEERALIPTVTVPADKNPESSVDPGYTTQDRIFVLSLTEVKQYMPTLSSRICHCTVYADRQGVMNTSTWSKVGPCYWWLRTPGTSRFWVTYVMDEGNIDTSGYTGKMSYVAVRPAMWIDLTP